ncbi:MAG: DMT family transporter [Gemmatimonadales bacterium]|nr:MAG: DMT family transporter [Gemmatimonadales bacterium]
MTRVTLPRLSRGLQYMAAGAFFFALMSALVKITGTRLPTMEIVLARSLVVLVIAWVTLRKLGVPVRGQRRDLLLLRGVFGFIALTSFYYAVIRLPLADVTVIQYTNPVFTALFAAVAIGEGLRRRELGLALVAMTGVIVMVRPAFLFGGDLSALPPLPAGVALVGAIFSAAAYVTVRFLGRGGGDGMGHREHPVVIVWWFALVSTIGSAPFLALDFVLPRGTDWLLLLGVGVTTHLGQLFLTLGLREERAGKAMAVAYLQIVFAGVWGLILFSEVPDVWTGVGALVIVLATWWVGRERTRRR